FDPIIDHHKSGHEHFFLKPISPSISTKASASPPSPVGPRSSDPGRPLHRTDRRQLLPPICPDTDASEPIYPDADARARDCLRPTMHASPHSTPPASTAITTTTAHPKLPLHVGSTLAHRHGCDTITAAYADDRRRVH
ncbi:hypothetical protein ACLOJK_015095, partial [Asimina triloba]